MVKDALRATLVATTILGLFLGTIRILSYVAAGMDSTTHNAKGVCKK